MVEQKQTDHLSSIPSKILSALVRTAAENARSVHGFKYKEEIVPKLASLVFLVGGRWLYEVLQKNLGLPSISTLSKVTNSATQPVIEGEFCFKELKRHLEDGGYPPAVMISEDGTRILNRIRYDVSSNTIVGFVPPTLLYRTFNYVPLQSYIQQCYSRLF